MPKRVGFLYEKMVDRGFIRKVILDSARYRHNRNDVARVLKDLDKHVELAYSMLKDGTYVPSQPKMRTIYDESSQKYREIKMVPYWPDGVMQWLLVAAMKPVLRRGMYHWSCASVPGRGTKRVHDHLQRAVRRDPKGTRYAAEIDVRHYYPSISIRRLIWMLARKIKDKRFLRMVYSILETCGEGLAIGYYICQWLANYYLEALDRYITTLPGVKYMTRHMDNYTLAGPNKKLLHKARTEIEQQMRRLGLMMKANWQVYRTSFTAAVEKKHRLLPEKQQQLRKPRMVSAVGYRYAQTHTVMRRRNFLRFARQCRRVKKRLDAGKPVSPHLAGSVLSRVGQLRHCDSHQIRVKYVDPIEVKKLKEVVRHESKRRQYAEQRLHGGRAS